ncbi:MAG: phage protease [Marinobacter sp.]|uniref:phage protease n=1 Tax=Marinobacter sp. TaxID=50741 RepID=UPI00299D3FC9|nr:phage protease [Marinobacter sp.]MDX1755879.1 phage protease [Marinobacter sp.]
MATKHHIQIAACTTSLGRKAAREIQLFPAGTFRARDGRPAGIDGWVMTADTARQVIALASRRATPFVIDYEHQTLHAETSGNPAPAAAWFERLEWREGDGLYAVDVEWTTKASAMIEADEYRYLSPVFKFNKTGEVTELLMAAVTNYPAIDGIADVAAARYLTNHPEEEHPVDEELLKLLGLEADATPEQVRAAIQALIDKATQAEADVAAARAEAGKPDPAKYVPVAALTAVKDQVAALTAKLNGSEVDNLVKQGLDDGRLLPAMENWARELGEGDVAALRSYLDNAQPVAALTGQQTGGKKPEGDDKDGLSEEELAVCRGTGIDPDDYAKQKEA